MKKITIEVPEEVSEEEIKLVCRILAARREILRDILEEYGLLKLQEESLKEFLESEPELYSEEDVKR
ncbi:MAG: hypothetical protein DRJ52_03020 [Thermoprotei archaeon]|nr:MAG: hypothetical protein DRJ52_03020 [Thermoprotei archaeon]RLF01029.1 MAG: hypothetical protein DRJ63_00395 [Thermoprotei archaeon]